MIRGSDGLDYEDLGQRLIGNPAPTHRNTQIRVMRLRGSSEEDLRLWAEAYDQAYAALGHVEHPFGNSRDWNACNRANDTLRTYRRLVAETHAQAAAYQDRRSAG